jgi:galactose oxidase
MIDFTNPLPRWRRVGNLIQPSTTSKAVALPDGKVFIANGLNPSGSTFEERSGLRYQMFDPSDATTRAVAKTTVPRGLHGTAVLLPDATVFVAGENREVLVRPDDPAFPMDGFPIGDPDLGVPNGQIFRPPYLFNKDGSLAARPVITESPEKISYRDNFEVSVAGGSNQIASVVIIRSDHSTHNLETGSRYVKLAFHAKDEGENENDGESERERELRVTSPRLPAQAIPGIYMLFVVDKAGVPSIGRQLRLNEEDNEDKKEDKEDGRG